MRHLLLLVSLCAVLFSEDFISEFEYGQMLYRDSRGVSCVPCHGETGEGIARIVSYHDEKGREVVISGPDIRHTTLKQMRESVKQGQGIMPRYFLTDREIKAIYAYLQTVNRESNTSNE